MWQLAAETEAGWGIIVHFREPGDHHKLLDRQKGFFEKFSPKQKGKYKKVLTYIFVFAIVFVRGEQYE